MTRPRAKRPLGRSIRPGAIGTALAVAALAVVAEPAGAAPPPSQSHLRPLPPAWTGISRTEALLRPPRPRPRPNRRARRWVPRPGEKDHALPAVRDACYRELRRRGVSFRPGPRQGGLIHYPVWVRGKVGGLALVHQFNATLPLLMDCQLALNFLRAAPVFLRHGIVKLLVNNTWRKPFWDFRRKRSLPGRGRRILNHPRGMAMDVAFLYDGKGKRYYVETAWRKAYGGPGNCTGGVERPPGARRLRSLICDLERAHIFRRILTPDTDWQHRHHFHFTGARLGERFARGRWAGRTLRQPLPGARFYRKWARWMRCYQRREPKARAACYQRRAKDLPRMLTRYRKPAAVAKRTGISLPGVSAR